MDSADDMTELLLKLKTLVANLITEMVGRVSVAGLEEWPGGLKPDGLTENGLDRVAEDVEEPGGKAPKLAKVENLQTSVPVFDARQQEGCLFNSAYRIKDGQKTKFETYKVTPKRLILKKFQKG